MSGQRILVAGIGNIFLGDDAFGVEVVRRMSEGPRAPNVHLVDFGIRGLDLAYALLENYALAVLVDAISRGGAPGTIYLLETEPVCPARGEILDEGLVEGHGMDPATVLRLAGALGGPTPTVRIVGCEPAKLVPVEEGQPVLSGPVEAAIPETVRIIESLVSDWRAEDGGSCTNSALPWRSLSS